MSPQGPLKPHLSPRCLSPAALGQCAPGGPVLTHEVAAACHALLSSRPTRCRRERALTPEQARRVLPGRPGFQTEPPAETPRLPQLSLVL